MRDSQTCLSLLGYVNYNVLDVYFTGMELQLIDIYPLELRWWSDAFCNLSTQFDASIVILQPRISQSNIYVIEQMVRQENISEPIIFPQLVRTISNESSLYIPRIPLKAHLLTPATITCWLPSSRDSPHSREISCSRPQGDFSCSKEGVRSRHGPIVGIPPSRQIISTDSISRH